MKSLAICTRIGKVSRVVVFLDEVQLSGSDEKLLLIPFRVNGLFM